jgi:tRNA pseudouridine55 synthase
MNGVLNINKPSGWTSHDVVAKTRGILKERQIGHLGTLDPLATGVLPLAIGTATRLIEFASYSKEYVTTCLLGKTTDSYDITGKVTAEKPVEKLPPERVREAVLQLQTLTQQVPPMVSALKQGGQKLYELARRGIEVERQPRPIRIQSVEVLQVDLPRVAFRVVCSPGTYVRSLCQTLGESLGTGGCMEKLERTQVGPFSLKDALTLEDVKKNVEAGNLSGILVAPSRLVEHLPELKLEDNSLQRFCQGLKLEIHGFPPGLYRVVNGQGRVSAIASISPDGETRPQKVFGMEGLL